MAGEDEVAAVTQSPVPAQENGSSQAQQQQQHLDETLSVKVALHIRPLIGPERVQGCKDCIYVIPGEPQVQIGSHNFTFDHIYGSSGIPAAKIFDDCVSPLVEGLFHGYNATVLAYGQMIRLVATVSPEVTKHQAELKQSSLITLAKLFKPETGSGKTYTMGTAYVVGGSTHGVIPQVMETIFNNVKTMGDKYDFQLRVAFIEILKEEVHDLLDLTPLTASKQEGSSGSGGTKTSVPAKPPIQIRETPTGEITLVGVTETTVSSLEEMASCLEQGSLCRATGSTNMNSHSSRSHAIFTISLEKRRKANVYSEKVPAPDDGDDFLCAKLHLVDLAGSERAKRTGADGIRFKEGVHINKGLLALGNVISALGDDKRRKEGGHVPYRDSKLTRLLQDSLGGNSRTVMIACVSPADSNAEETLNTLKYANRARNIQNKPIVNRDPMVAEMQRLRQQVELLQAELMCVRAGSCPFDDMQIVLKEKMAWLESKNTELRRELQESRDNSQLLTRKVVEAELEKDKLLLRLQMLHNGGSHDDLDETQSMDVLEKYARKIHDLESEVQKMRNMSSGSLVHSSPALSLSLSPHYTELPESGGISDANVEDEDNDDAEDIDEEEMEEEEEEEEEGKDEDEEGEETAAKELEHTIWQDNMDQELQELNRRLELKEAEMKKYVTKVNGATIKHHFEKKISELEEEKKSLQKEKDTLQSEIEKLASQSDDNTQKVQETYKQKLKDLESQISELKKKQENQAQLLKQKQRSDEAVKQLNDEILRIKTQKVQLQNKMKQESEQFRQWKASREKEVLQLRKEGRKNEYQMHKLQALHQRQKMVLQRKTEEAAQATRRLKELLEARKPSFREKEGSGTAAANGSAGQAVNEKSLQKWLEHELEVAVHIHEVRNNYEKQKETRAALAKELAKLKQEEELHQAYLQESMKGNETASSAMKAPATSMSSDARLAKIRYIEGVLNASSSTLVAMASQLSEAEERERGFNGRARWQHLRTMGDAKSLLQTAFNSATFARCELWSKERENKELKGKIMKLTELMQKNEARRKEERQQAVGGQDVAKPLPSIKEANNGEIDERTHGVVDNTSVARLSRGSQPPQQIESGSTASFATTPPFDKHKSYNAYHGEVDSSTEGESDMDLVDDGNQSNNEWSEEDSEQAEEGKGGGSSGRNRPRGANNAARSKSKGASSASAGWEFPSMQEDDRTDRAGGPSQAGSGAHEEGRRRNRRATEEEQRASSQSSSTTTAAAAANCQNSTPSSASSPLLPTRGAEEEGTTGDRVQESACQRSSSPQPTQQEVMREVEMAEALDRLGEPDIDEATRSHAVEVLRHHGAAILREALREGEGFRSASPPRDNAIGRRRRPLADIGNGNAQAARNRQRGRELRKPWRKTVVVQIVSIPPVQPEGETRPPPPPPIHGFLSNPESERLTVPATPLAENWHEDRDASPNTNAAQMLLQGRRKKGGGTGSPNSPRLSPARARTINNNNNSNNNNNTRTGALLSSSSSSSSSSSFSSSSLSSRSEKKQHPSSSSHSSPSSPSASPSFSGSDKENV